MLYVNASHISSEQFAMYTVQFAKQNIVDKNMVSNILT